MSIRFLATLLVLLSFSSISSSLIHSGFRAGLRRPNSSVKHTKDEQMRQSVSATKSRLEALNTRMTDSTSTASAPLFSAFYEYIIDFEIGTPPQPVSAIVDSGSDLLWTQCLPCDQCVTQTLPYFNPSDSSTFSEISCSDSRCLYKSEAQATCTSCQYQYTYATPPPTSGILATETLTFGDQGVSIPNVVFGCNHMTALHLDNAGGIIGLSPGPLSLITQLESPRFSYCLDLDSTESNPSALFVGSMASMNGATGAVQSTPFVPSSIKAYYFIDLTGISLGDTLLPVSSVFEASGTVIDSGTSITSLVQPAYDAVVEAVTTAVNLPRFSGQGPTGLCFDVSSSPAPSVPDMTFHFNGADMVVPYMYTFADQGLFCLMMAQTPTSFSLVGNFQQQNQLVLYDIEAQTLSFAPADCGAL